MSGPPEGGDSAWARRAAIEAVFRAEHGRIVGTLIRETGDWDLAEDALMDALTSALERWPLDGLPERPGAWLTAAARRRVIDRRRREQTQRQHAPALRARQQQIVEPQPTLADEACEDDGLRLLFTCCHPSLAPEAQVALTLRYAAGLSTRQVARMFLQTQETMAKRLTRAKTKIREAGIPFRVPPRGDLAARLAVVAQAIYLVFTEGYVATEGQRLVANELCREAVRLGEQLLEWLPADAPERAEAGGLLALMRLTHARHPARIDGDGELVLLADQDRALWDQPLLMSGRAALECALDVRASSGVVGGPYLLQACIAELHSIPDAERTDWPQICALYQALVGLTRNPVVMLNHAVALAMAGDPNDGLALMERYQLAERLPRYALFHAARADLWRRSGEPESAMAAYRAALELTDNAPQRRFLHRRLLELGEA